MIMIEDKIVSHEILTECFLCNYEKCKGICCIDGDSGAPLNQEELPIIQSLLPQILPLLTEKAQEVIRKEGISYIDFSGEEVTSLVDGGQCVFAHFDENKNCFCAFEVLYRKGLTTFPKPISCHLYPIRLHYYAHATALNYDRWDICRGAIVKGKRKGVRIYQALKEPIIRAFGESFYEELEACAKLLKKEKTLL